MKWSLNKFVFLIYIVSCLCNVFTSVELPGYMALIFGFRAASEDWRIFLPWIANVTFFFSFLFIRIIYVRIFLAAATFCLSVFFFIYMDIAHAMARVPGVFDPVAEPSITLGIAPFLWVFAFVLNFISSMRELVSY